MSFPSCGVEHRPVYRSSLPVATLESPRPQVLVIHFSFQCGYLVRITHQEILAPKVAAACTS